MVKKTFCDYCKGEIEDYRVKDVNDMVFLNEAKHICKLCVQRVTEFLHSIQK